MAPSGQPPNKLRPLGGSAAGWLQVATTGTFLLLAATVAAATTYALLEAVNVAAPSATANGRSAVADLPTQPPISTALTSPAATQSPRPQQTSGPAETPAPIQPTPELVQPTASPVEPTRTPRAPTAEPGRDAEPLRLSEGESAVSQCGEGTDGTFVKFVDDEFYERHAHYANVGGTHELAVDVWREDSGFSVAAAGAQLEWRFVRARGGQLTVEGCRATFSGSTSPGNAEVFVRVFFSQPLPSQQPIGEGGPIFVDGRSTTTAIIQVLDENGSGHAPSGACGREWLQVSLSGPNSGAAIFFWIRGPGTSYVAVGPFANRGTFQVTPGTYDVIVPGITSWRVQVPECGWARVTWDGQGWGEALP